MSINATADELLTDLHVISLVPPGGRLCIRQGRLSVERNTNGSQQSIYSLPSNISVALRRWFNHDNRTNTIVLMTTSILRTFDLIKEIEKSSKSNSSWLLEQFQEKLRSANKGIENMILTYKNDATTYSKLVIISDRIKQNIL